MLTIPKCASRTLARRELNQNRRTRGINDSEFLYKFCHKCSCTQTSSFEEDASSAGVGTAAKDEVVTTTESFQQEETKTKQETTRLFPTEV
jgi:hypothetical protein